MAKMFSLTTIQRKGADGQEEIIPKGRVFDADPKQAKQLDALKGARPALPEEIEAANAALARANGGQGSAEPEVSIKEKKA